jgi:hypothetical protein
MALTSPTITGYSAFWQITGDSLPYNLVNNKNSQRGRSPQERAISQLLLRNQFRDVAAVWIALTGAASGSNATATYKRNQAQVGPDATTPIPTDVGSMGGNRTIETVTVLNRNTTAADVTYLKDFLDGDLVDRSISYPTVSGSGGGGKIVNGVPTF